MLTSTLPALLAAMVLAACTDDGLTNDQAEKQGVELTDVGALVVTQTPAPTSAGLRAIIPTADLAIPTGYTGVSALNFASPNNSGATGAIDGNASGNRTT